MKNTHRKDAKTDSAKKPLPEPTLVAADVLGHAAPSFFNDVVLKKFFFSSLIVMLLITWATGRNIGFHQDEIDMNSYGKACASYYTSGGKDTSFRGNLDPLMRIDSFLKYYGCGFEYMSVAANKITGNTNGKQEFNVRHYINEFLGILALMFTGLIASKLADWRAAILSIYLVYFSPSFFGHVYFNTKDIPFCLGYAASLYYTICMLQELPAVSWKTAVKLMLSFAFITSIRIAGIMWVFYIVLFTAFYLFTNWELLAAVLKNTKSIIIKYAAIFGGGMILVIVTWPFLLQNPISNTIAAMELIKKYPMKININFVGETINSFTLPPNYIPKLLGITTPVFILAMMSVGLVFLVTRYKLINGKLWAVFLFAYAFPLAYAIATHAVMYTGWRHFLFIYPAIGILAAFGCVKLYDYLSKKALKISFAVTSFALLYHPVTWAIRNHPYEYCYYNELSGGFKNVFYNYDTDYWQITMKNEVDWVMRNEAVVNAHDTITIATNIPLFVKPYILQMYPRYKVNVIDLGYSARNVSPWTFAVFSSYLLSPEYLEHYFPSGNTCHSENIEGMPVTIVIKDTSRLDLLAINATTSGKHREADSLYHAFFAYSKDYNPTIDAFLSVTKAYLNQNDSAITFANRALNYHFSSQIDYYAKCGLGIAYANKGQLAESINELRLAQALNPEDQTASNVLNQVLNMQKMKEAGSGGAK